jgi:RNA 2',3'-cyclic 3'-phosphodiesterase
VIRAFAAIALPEAVRHDLMLVQMGLPVPRVVETESLHLTLVFLGELPRDVLADVDAALSVVRVPGFTLTLRGLGIFGGRRPRLVHAGVGAEAGLMRLQAKLETAARGAGVEVPARRYVPHVTLARLPERFPERGRLEQAVVGRSAYAAPRFAVEDFRLFRSHLGGEGASYEELARYPLG